MYTIIPISAFNDNYIWLIEDPRHSEVAVVDPGDADPVIHHLQSHQLTLSAILLTHHHSDHSGGIEKLRETYSVPVFGPKHEKVLHATHPLEGNEVITLPHLEFSTKVLAIPGHTLGHIAFYGQGLLFCGDTLFAGGCGRLFEGTAAQMFQSLQSLAALDPQTKIYCGHEYTEANLKFAACVEPNNVDLQQRILEVRAQREKLQCTLPSTLQLELLTNPFLRCHTDSVKSAVSDYCKKSLSNPVEVFAELRAWKNVF